MKKIAHIFLFVALFFAGDRLFSAVLGNMVMKSGTKFSVLYRGANSHDIVIMGNSRGDSSFTPSDITHLVGLAAFQLSHKGTSMEVADVLWRDYLERNRAPKILLIEASALSDSNEILSDLKSYAYWSKRMDDLIGKENALSQLTTRFIHLFYWNGELIFRSFFFLSKSDQDKNKLNTSIIDHDLAAKYLAEAREKHKLWTIRENNLAALNRMVEAANERGCRAYIIISPYYPGYGAQFREEIKLNAQIIQSQVGKLAGILDYSSSIDDPSAFKDLTHLNYQGSKLLLSYLALDIFHINITTKQRPRPNFSDRDRDMHR